MAEGMRAYELARELGVAAKALIEVAAEAGVNLKGFASRLSADAERVIRQRIAISAVENNVRAIEAVLATPSDPEEKDEEPSEGAAGPHSLNLIDTVATFRVLDVLRRATGNSAIKFDYARLLRVLEEHRISMGNWDLGHTVNYAPVVVDPKNERQVRFVRALRGLGIQTTEVDIEDAVVEGTGVSERGDSGGGPVFSVIADLAYILGILAGRADPEVIVVTDSFSLFRSMKDFVLKRKGKCTLAFFGSMLDSRWRKMRPVDLGDRSSFIDFLDLDKDSESLVGVGKGSLASAFGPRGDRGGLDWL